MGFRDPHAILLNRSSILVVTSVGVALLTLSYVLGVQVGKQSAALQRPSSKGSGEDLKALPEPILDQLRSLDGAQEDTPPVPDSKKDAKTETKSMLKAEPKPDPTVATPSTLTSTKWTLQLLSTADKTEADRVSTKAKAAGYAAQVVKEKGAYKVRWNHAGAKPDVDATAIKMKAVGFKPFAVPVE